MLVLQMNTEPVVGEVSKQVSAPDGGWGCIVLNIGDACVADEY